MKTKWKCAGMHLAAGAVLIVLFLLLAVPDSAAQQFGARVSLYSDVKAHRVGDIVTILIYEDARGSNRSGSEIRKENKLGFSAGSDGATSFIPLSVMSTRNNVEFLGEGTTDRKGQLRGKLTGRIVSIDENGNYVIEGTREIEINNEKQLMKLTGIVRPQDVMQDNTILSYYISDAKISYKGKGLTSASQKPGWITRFFNWLF